MTSVKMAKSPWPADIPNGTKGRVLEQRGEWTEVEWSTGHVLRMKQEEISE